MDDVKEVRNAYQRKYYAEHREARNEYQRKYYAEHKDQCKGYIRKHWEKKALEQTKNGINRQMQAGGSDT